MLVEDFCQLLFEKFLIFFVIFLFIIIIPNNEKTNPPPHLFKKLNFKLV